MTATLYDLGNKKTLLNESKVLETDSLLHQIEKARGAEPHFLNVVSDFGFELLLGIAKQNACAQHSSSSGAPPYLMAVASAPVRPDDFTDILAGGTPSPVSNRYLLPIEDIKDIATYFLQTGKADPSAIWEEI